MHGLTISDLARDGTLAVGLEDILTTLGPDAERAWWKTTGLECLGPSAEKLYSLTDEGAFILGRSLVSLSRGLTQVIDGEFDAYRDGTPITIICNDSQGHAYALNLTYSCVSAVVALRFPSHTAEKAPGHALAVVKAQQDLRHTTRVMTNSEKTGYRKRRSIVNAPLLVLSNALKP